LIVSPAGMELGVSVTIPLKPPTGMTETLKLPLPPTCAKLRLLGLAACF
jgi:hypothetical protein